MPANSTPIYTTETVSHPHCLSICEYHSESSIFAVLFAIILKKSIYDLGSYLHHHLLQEYKNKLAQSCNVQRQRLEVSILKVRGLSKQSKSIQYWYYMYWNYYKMKLKLEKENTKPISLTISCFNIEYFILFSIWDFSLLVKLSPKGQGNGSFSTQTS